LLVVCVAICMDMNTFYLKHLDLNKERLLP
jgi:hypothetical protein